MPGRCQSRTRIDMLTTGDSHAGGNQDLWSRTLKEIEEIGTTAGNSAQGPIPWKPGPCYAERVAGGYFVDFDLKRDQLPAMALTVADAQTVVMSAIGGENVTTTIEGRARYPVNVRYPRELTRQSGTAPPGVGPDTQWRPDSHRRKSPTSNKSTDPP